MSRLSEQKERCIIEAPSIRWVERPETGAGIPTVKVVLQQLIKWERMDHSDGGYEWVDVPFGKEDDQ